MFPSVSEMISDNDSLADHIGSIVKTHLENLKAAFEKQFPSKSDPRENSLWVVNPFLNFDEPNELSSIEMDQLIGDVANIHLSVCICIMSYFKISFPNRNYIRSYAEEIVRVFAPGSILD